MPLPGRRAAPMRCAVTRAAAADGLRTLQWRRQLNNQFRDFRKMADDVAAEDAQILENSRRVELLACAPASNAPPWSGMPG